jgi:hypothetical protein
MLTGSLSWLKALTCSEYGLLLLVGGWSHLSFAKRTFVGWMSESWTQKDWDRSATSGRGEIILAEGLHNWGRRAVLLFNYTLAFALQLRKIRKTSVSVAEQCETLIVVTTWPTEHQSSSVNRGWHQTSLGRQKCFPGCRTKGCPPSANFGSKLSINVLMWSAKNEIPKSSWISLLQTCQAALVAMRKHLDCNNRSFRKWLQAANLQMGYA